jgi:hypothetical protein
MPAKVILTITQGALTGQTVVFEKRSPACSSHPLLVLIGWRELLVAHALARRSLRDEPLWRRPPSAVLSKRRSFH